MTITSFYQHRGCCGAFCLEAHILIFIAFDDLPSSYTFRRKISRNDVNTDKNSSALTRMIQTSPIRHSAGDMQGLHVLLRSMVMKDGIFFFHHNLFICSYRGLNRADTILPLEPGRFVMTKF